MLHLPLRRRCMLMCPSFHRLPSVCLALLISNRAINGAAISSHTLTHTHSGFQKGLRGCDRTHRPPYCGVTVVSLWCWAQRVCMRECPARIIIGRRPSPTILLCNPAPCAGCLGGCYTRPWRLRRGRRLRWHHRRCGQCAQLVLQHVERMDCDVLA